MVINVVYVSYYCNYTEWSWYGSRLHSFPSNSFIIFWFMHKTVGIPRVGEFKASRRLLCHPLLFFHASTSIIITIIIIIIIIIIK